MIGANNKIFHPQFISVQYEIFIMVHWLLLSPLKYSIVVTLSKWPIKKHMAIFAFKLVTVEIDVFITKTTKQRKILQLKFLILKRYNRWCKLLTNILLLKKNNRWCRMLLKFLLFNSTNRWRQMLSNFRMSNRNNRFCNVLLNFLAFSLYVLANCKHKDTMGIESDPMYRRCLEEEKTMEHLLRKYLALNEIRFFVFSEDMESIT